MVGRLIQNQDVAPHNHHAGEQHADLLAAGEDAHLLGAVFPGKKHAPEKAAHIGCILNLGKLGQPVHDDEVGVKDFRVVLREIRLACRHTPFIGTGIRLELPGKNFEQGCFCQLIAADKRDLVIATDDKGDIVENFYAVYALCETFYRQHFVADVPVRPEINVRVLTAGGPDLVELYFFEGALARGRLL